MLLTSLLLSTLAYTLVVQPVRASGTICIKADGSIDPPGAPILRNGDLYTFSSNIYDSIIVERNNILVDGAGYTTQGSGIGTGIDLSGRGNVTIRNVNIKGFQFGVYMDVTSRSAILGSNITNNDEGISSYTSSDNLIFGNNISTNVYEGISLYYSSNNNIISENSISANVFDGIYLFSSSDNNISANNISGNGYGISPYYSSNNRVFHNNFVNNTFQTNPDSPLDVWDNGYPSGGNYWSDYDGADSYSGPYQNGTGSDGVGDTPYVIDGSNQDNYPLMTPHTPHDLAVIHSTTSRTVVGQGYSVNINATVANRGDFTETFNVTAYANVTAIRTETLTLPSGNSTIINFTWNTSGFAKGKYGISAYAWPVPGETDVADNSLNGAYIFVTLPGDANGDKKVNILDAITLANSFNSKPGDINWNPNADINGDDKVNILDAIVLAAHFNQSWA